MYAAMAAKQQLYDQRVAVLTDKVTHCREVINYLRGQDYDTYNTSFISGVKTVSRYDFTDDSQYYAALDWIATFQRQALELLVKK
jgi:hypothetical protein